MKYMMNLNAFPFFAIKAGTKTIEMRLYDEKRQKLKIGDGIEFINRNNNESLNVKIIKLHKYKTFDELYSYFDKEKIGYNKGEVANPKDMSRYYDSNDIERYGVIGIEIKKI